MRTFDPAAEFLLKLGYLNLFEPADARPGSGHTWRCKGCQEIVLSSEREKHHSRHKATFAKARARTTEAARGEALAKARAVLAAKRAEGDGAEPAY